jgi:hypothetical protein
MQSKFEKKAITKNCKTKTCDKITILAVDVFFTTKLTKGEECKVRLIAAKAIARLICVKLRLNDTELNFFKKFLITCIL